MELSYGALACMIAGIRKLATASGIPIYPRRGFNMFLWVWPKIGHPKNWIVNVPLNLLFIRQTRTMSSIPLD